MGHLQDSSDFENHRKRPGNIMKCRSNVILLNYTGQLDEISGAESA